MNQIGCVVFLLVPLFCGAFPQNGISQEEQTGKQCFICNSKEHPDCASPDDFLPPGRCKDPKDECITAVIDGVTHRGCKQEMNVPSNAISETCGSDHCNDKLFPKDRLQCYQCQGSYCVSFYHNTLKACVNYDKGDYCVTDVIDEKNIIRACKSDTNRSPTKYAKMCQNYACNDHPPTYSALCMSCSEANSTNCARTYAPDQSGMTCRVTNDNFCKTTALLQRPLQCFTYKASKKVVRGCPQDAGKLAEDKNNYKLCEWNYCNDLCIPIKCHKCDSRTHPKCANHVNELEPELCPKDMACFAAQTTEGAIVRGCGNKSPKDSQSTVCSADGCNTKTYPPLIKKRECHHCNSNKLAECATNPSASLPHVQCKDANDQCVTAVVNGVTHRGCEKEMNVTKDAISGKCNSDLCNGKIFPENRLKCFQCEGANCVKDLQKTLKPCVNYSKDDSCVTDVKDETNVSRMCLSDSGYSVPQFAAVCKGAACNSHPPTYTSECLTCSQANVNDTCVRISTPIPAGQKCTLPKAHTCQETLLLNRPAECFTYKASGKVVRGCVKDAGKLALEKHNFETCHGALCNNKCLSIKCVKCDSRKEAKCDTQADELTPQLCPGDMYCFTAQTPDGANVRGCGKQFTEGSKSTACYADGCNTKTYYPLIKKRKCHHCDSNKLAECATNPSASLPHVQCKDARDQCVTAVVNGITYRGCENELKVTKDAIFAKCDSSLCNGKLFPENRLQCYQCEGKNCPKDLKSTLKPCVNYVKEDSCVTDVKGETNVSRKCLSDPGYTAPKYAEVCKVAGCNNHPATYTSECVSCSQTDVNANSCVRTNSANKTCTLPNDHTCKETLLLNRPAECFTYKASQKVVRGCTKNAGKLALDKENFRTCEGRLCNDECLPITCVKCDSKTNPKCLHQAYELKPELCPSDMSCFAAQTSDGAIIRGCGNQFTKDSKSTACYTDGCNKKTFPLLIKRCECHKCDSNKLAECATNPSPSLPHAPCKDPKDQCVTAVVNGITHRGCEKELNVTKDAISGKCNSDLCNGKIFPENRLQCYQCEGKDCAKDLQKTLKPCVNYVKDDSCVTEVKDESNISRKCLSDPGYSAPKYAEVCKVAGCNNHSATYISECLSCAQTDANLNSCVRTSSPGAANKTWTLQKDQTCKETLLLNRPAECFTYKASGKVVRGCLKDAGKLTLDKDNFETCRGELCNNQCLPIKCVKCDSRKEPKCANHANKLQPELCPNDMACFVAQTADGATIRGCGEHFTGASRISTCLEDGCIKELPPSSGCIGTDCNKGREVDPSTSCKGGHCKKGTESSPNVNCHGNGCNKNSQIIPRHPCRKDCCNRSCVDHHPIISVNGEHNLVIIFD